MKEKSPSHTHTQIIITYWQVISIRFSGVGRTEKKRLRILGRYSFISIECERGGETTFCQTTYRKLKFNFKNRFIDSKLKLEIFKTNGSLRLYIIDAIAYARNRTLQDFFDIFFIILQLYVYLKI